MGFSFPLGDCVGGLLPAMYIFLGLLLSSVRVNPRKQSLWVSSKPFVMTAGSPHPLLVVMEGRDQFLNSAQTG